MKSIALRFECTQSDQGEHVRLIRSTPSRLPFGKAAEAIVPFDDWSMEAAEAARPTVARLLQAWADGETAPDGDELVSMGGDGVILHPAMVASLSDSEALAIGLPPTSRLSVNLQSIGVAHQPDFRIELRWTRPNGLAAPAQIQGARVRTDGKDWRIAEPIWSTLKHVERLNSAASEPERQAALAALRRAIGDEERHHIRPDGFIERLRLSYAAGFSLDLKPDAAGFDFDPILFSPERKGEAESGDTTVDEVADNLLPPKQHASFTRRFRQGDGSRSAYLLDDGSILFIDPALQKALSVVRNAQAGGPDVRRAFATNPQRYLGEALAASGIPQEQAQSLFIETQQFSERVSGIDVWRKPVLPWIKPKPNSWLPEAFGLRVGSPPDETMLEIAPAQVSAAIEALEAAVRENRSTFSFSGEEIPATEQTRESLEALRAVASPANADDEHEAGAGPLPTASRERYFLQVRDNLEDVIYAPLAKDFPVADLPPPAFPTEVATKPKPHQVTGFEWLVACWRKAVPGTMLADDMGLGKTFQALSFLAWCRQQQGDPKPILIVAPTGLLKNWQAEIERHLEPRTLGRIVNAYGGDLKRMRGERGKDIEAGNAGIDADAWLDAGVVLTTFETMRDYHLSFARQPFSVIVYDEAQKLKNPSSQMTRAAKTLNARFQLAMTGTPVENRLQDLWSIYDVVHPGLLGSSKSFELSYPPDASAKLRDLHKLLTEPLDQRPPVLLRRMKDECLAGLPAKHVHSLPIQMPEAQAQAYNGIIQRALIARDSGQRGYMLEILHMLRGVSLHPIGPEAAADDYFSLSARLQAMFDTLDAIHRKGEKVLIFCESLQMQGLLAIEIRRRFGLSRTVPRIHGGVTGDFRQTIVDEFQARAPGFDVMILSPKAGGVGITLTAANHVIHLSRWWNPAVEDQATDRAYRIGQTRDVHVYIPQAVHPDPAVAPLSFDLKLDALMRRKRELSRELLLPGESEGDTAGLFDEVLGASSYSESGSEADGPSPDPLPDVSSLIAEPPEPSAGREVLQLRSGQPPKQAWPPRARYEPNRPRSYDIFKLPIAKQRITDLIIRDPYACADGRNRECLVEFLRILASSAASIENITIFCYDPESCGRDYETPSDQRRDLEQRWARRMPGGLTVRLVQMSKRQDRYFHDRHVKADTVSGKLHLWDISNGIDGVILPHKECTVNYSVG